jgi:hypothetical protein
VSVEVQATPTRRGERAATLGTETSSRRAGRSSRLDLVWIFLLLGFIGVVVPLVVADRYGALGIPRSDDWSYLLTLFRWVDSGELTFNGWVSMTLVGQVAIAAPIAAVAERSITAVQLFQSMVGLVGLLCVVFIGRQMVRPAWWAVFVAATIAAGPLWGPLAPTFMTDVPTFTFEMLTLSAAAVAFRRRPLSLPWFAVSVVLGFVGVSIRQYAVIPVIAIVLVALCLLVADKEWRKLRAVVVIAAVFGLATVAILYWWSGLPDSKSLSPTMPTGHTISAVLIKNAGFLRLSGLLLLPVVVLAGPVAIVRRAWRTSRNLTTALTAFMVIWLVAMYVRVPKTPFVGNYVARDGVLSEVVLAGNRPDVVPRALFELLVVLGSVAGMLIVLTAVPFVADLPRRIRERDISIASPLIAIMGLTVVGFAIAYSIATLTGLPLYDRYGLPVLPLLAFLVLRSMQHEPALRHSVRPRQVWAGVAIAGIALLGLVYSVDSASFDGTRWEVAKLATQKGYSPTQVGGGFEWLGYHREHGPSYRWGGEGGEVNPNRLPYSPPCVTVIINPPHPERGYVAAGTAYSPFVGDVAIVARRNARPCLEGRGAPADDDSTPIARRP